ncbi:MAG: rhamnosyltransferase [Petroclostridium sp.]|nr:rhamnosyltransferase [Petroclostridium sp.]
MEKIRLIGIVIIYNFDIDELIKNIERYLFGLDKLVIWQNTILTEENKVAIRNIEYSERIMFLGNGENNGISLPINSVIKEFGGVYDYLMTMDQDSYWINFTEYISTIFEYDNDDQLYIYGPRIVDSNLYEINRSEYIYDKSINIVDHVITSGAIYNIGMFDTIGKFNEKYFIDAVDEEICCRANKHNISTLRINGGLLAQTFGEPQIHKFLWKNITYNKYGSSRLYFIVRNHIWLVREYKFPLSQSWIIIYNYVIRPSIRVILFDEVKIHKLSKVFKGIVDGITRSKGEIRAISE